MNAPETVPLLFDEATHTYSVGGIVLPSVTQVLKRLYDYDGIPEAILERASARGRYVHACAQAYDEDDLDLDAVVAEWRPYVDAWMRFRDDAGDRLFIIAAESPMYHPTLQYAGTPDRIALYEDDNTILEIKTYHQMSPVDALQTMGYKLIVDKRAGKVERRITVHLRKDGTYKLYEWTEPGDGAVFLAELTSYRWRQNHGKAD